MLAPQSTFEPETVALMRRVFETAWREIQAKYFLPSSDDTNQFGIFVAHRIIAAAAGGERDPERLKAAALQGFEAFPALSETDPADIVRSSVHINFSNGMNDHAASSGGWPSSVRSRRHRRVPPAPESDRARQEKSCVALESC